MFPTTKTGRSDTKIELDVNITKVMLYDISPTGDFDYAWTQIIISKVRECFSYFSDMVLVPNRKCVSEEEVIAHNTVWEDAVSRRADVVVWGQYAVSRSYCQPLIHIEDYYQEETTYYNDLICLNDLDTFAAQNRFAEQICYISLFVAALKQYNNRKYEPAIEKLSFIIEEMGSDGWPEWWRAKEVVYLVRGMAYVQTGNIQQAISDLRLASCRLPDEKAEIAATAEKVLKDINKSMRVRETCGNGHKRSHPKKKITSTSNGNCNGNGAVTGVLVSNEDLEVTEAGKAFIYRMNGSKN